MRKGCILIVDLNLQISSLKSKKNRLTKIIIIAVTAALLLVGTVPSFAAEAQSADIDYSDAPEVAGTSVIMIDGGSGDILYEKNSRQPRDPASITKILTCLVVLENMELDEKVTVKHDPIDIGEKISIKKGEVLTVEQLLYAMMLPSANDAAEVLAIAAGGDMETFCKMMNDKAKECGAEKTNFTNANGLNVPGQEKHRTTAYDIAMISKEAMKNKTFRKLVSSEKYTIPATNMSDERILRSTNPCLGLYEGTTGIKTGTTSVAGYCFCGAAKKDDTELIVVNLNSKEDLRFSETIKLWDYGFSKYYTYKAADGKTEIDDVKVKRGDLRSVQVGASEDLDVTLNKSYDSKNITTGYELDSKELKAPIKKGTKVGTLTAYNESKEAVASVPLVTLEPVEEGGILSYIGIADEDRILFAAGVVIAFLLLMIIMTLRKRMKRKKYVRRRAKRQRNVRRREWEKEKNPFNNDL